ncbi:hypothetical protein ACHAXR_004458 [Thalassiosira sp. AJA248-18]
MHIICCIATLQERSWQLLGTSKSKILCDNPKFGSWVMTQRNFAKAGKVTDDRIKRLNSIGFVFDVPAYLMKWNAQFGALQCYKTEHGHCLVPRSYSEDPQWASWVDWQRQAAKVGKVSDDQMKRLHSIGFIFEVQDNKWDVQFDVLQCYKNEHGHGHCSVPQRLAL